MRTRYNIIERRLVEAKDAAALVTVYLNPDDKEQEELTLGLKVDPHTLRSALDPDEVARLEVAPDHTAVILKRPKSYTPADNLSFQVASMGAFLFQGRLVLAATEDLSFFDSAEQLGARTPGALFAYAVLRLVTHFREHLKVISLILDDLQEKLLRGGDDRQLTNAFTLAKSLVYYQDALAANQQVLADLVGRGADVGLSTDELRLLEDAAIENRQCHKQAELYSVILGRLLAVRATIAGNAATAGLSTLARALVALLVPGLVLALFAMSAPTPFGTAPWVFWAVLGLAVLSGLLASALWHPRR